MSILRHFCGNEFFKDTFNNFSKNAPGIFGPSSCDFLRSTQRALQFGNNPSRSKKNKFLQVNPSRSKKNKFLQVIFRSHQVIRNVRHKIYFRFSNFFSNLGQFVKFSYFLRIFPRDAGTGISGIPFTVFELNFCFSRVCHQSGWDCNLSGTIWSTKWRGSGSI